jgi:ATP synthase protein I
MLPAIFGGPVDGAPARGSREKTLQGKSGNFDPHGAGDGPTGKSSSEEELDRRLRSLDERLDRREEARKPAGGARASNAGMAAALRLSTDFVAAVLVGAALGYGLDWLAGTAPWGMIILLILGFCAGVLNVLRSAGRIADPHAGRMPPRPAEAARDLKDDDEEE